MRPKHLLAAAIAALALGSAARAAEPAPLYVGAGLGLSMFHDNDVSSGGTATASYDAGFGFAGALGWRVAPVFRVEGEVAYRKNGLHDVGGDTRWNAVSLTVWSYGVNGYYDFASRGLPLKPFVGIGVGYARGDASGGGLSQSASAFSYQGIAGLALPFDERGSFTLQYRYHASSDFSKDGLSIAYGSSTLLAGITYAFSL